MEYDYKKAISDIEAYHRSQKHLIVRDFCFVYFSRKDNRYHYKSERGVSKHEILDKADAFMKKDASGDIKLCNIYCTDIYELHLDDIYRETYMTKGQLKYYVSAMNKEIESHGKQIQKIS